jgi:DNA polymerase-3 subunit epsilon
MILFWDTETSGIPNDGLPDDHASQPYMVELGCVLCAEDGTERSCANLIVRPDGWTVPDGAARVHGITTDLAARFGVPLPLVVATFCNLRSIAAETVAYNQAFDQKIMRYAIARTGREPSHPGPDKRTDLMEIVTPIVALPPTDRMVAAGYGHKHKPPKLSEAYRHFFSEDLQGAHGAIYDARAAARIFFHCRREGLIPNVQPQAAA